MLLHHFPAIQYVWQEPQHLDSDLCHQRVMRHMNTEVALLTVVVEQRLAQHGGCDCHHSVLLFYVAMGDRGV